MHKPTETEIQEFVEGVAYLNYGVGFLIYPSTRVWGLVTLVEGDESFICDGEEYKYSEVLEYYT